jgi:hypothetical protein
MPFTVLGQNKNVEKTMQANVSERKLRYVMATNGGLLGFYNDGTVAECPRCDLLKSNIAVMAKQKTKRKYQSSKDHLIIDGDERLDIYIDGKVSPDWAMVDYKWLSSPE